MSDLTLLTVTRGEPYAQPFLEAMRELGDDLGAGYVEWDGAGVRCIEDVLDQAVASCPDGYILRLDDDERVSPQMRYWLLARHYREHDHWAFPRLHLWPTEESYITTDPLYPDLQTRLSAKEKSGGRGQIHVGSPFGTGTVAPCPIEHWKFLVRDKAERQTLLEHYESITPGAGSYFLPFSLPEAMARLDLAVYRASVTA